MVDGIPEGTSGVADAAAGIDNSTDTSSGGDNPAWNGILTVIPGALHDTVKGHLRNWDTGVQQAIQKVHSEYEPYKVFREQGVGGEDLQSAYQLYQAFNETPERVYEGLTQWLREQGKLPPEQGQEQQPNAEEFQTEEFSLEGNPQFQQLQQQQQQMQQFLQQQVEQQARQAADAELDTALSAVQEKIGQLDKNGFNYVLNVANAIFQQNGGNLTKAIEQAGEAYQQIRAGIAQTPRPGASAPVITPSSGGVPVQNVNPADLPDNERRALGAEMINRLRSQT